MYLYYSRVEKLLVVCVNSKANLLLNPYNVFIGILPNSLAVGFLHSIVMAQWRVVNFEQ